MKDYSAAARTLAAIGLLAVLGAAACGRATADDAAPPSADVPEVVAAGGPSSEGAADVQELRDYTLTMDDVRKWASVGSTLSRLAAEHPELEEQESEESGDGSIAAMDATMERIPEARRAIEDAGLTVHEYSVVTFVLMQTMMAQAAVDQGANADALIAKAGINPKNLAFARDHRAELDRVFADVRRQQRARATEE